MMRDRKNISADGGKFGHITSNSVKQNWYSRGRFTFLKLIYNSSSLVWICVLNYHKSLPTLALNLSKNY